MMRNVRSTTRTLLLGVALLLLAPASLLAARPISLEGNWRFEMDPSDAGEQPQWFNRNLRSWIKLPGILQSQNYGDQITTRTPWVLTLYDRFWYLREDYRPYIEPGKVKEPVVWAIDDWNRNYKLGGCAAYSSTRAL